MTNNNFMRRLLLEAAHRQGWKADKWIARGLGVSQPMPSLWRHGDRLPSDEIMLSICQAAGYPPHLGLLQLHRLKARTPDVAAIFADLEEHERAALPDKQNDAAA